MIYELQKYLIVIIGFTFAFFEMRLYSMYTKDPTKILLAVIGIFWGIYYTFSILRGIFGWWNISTHQIFVRPGILFTISVLLARVYKRWRFLNDL